MQHFKKKLNYDRFREAKATIKCVENNATQNATHEALKFWHAIEIFVRSRQPCRWLQNHWQRKFLWKEPPFWAEKPSTVNELSLCWAWNPFYKSVTPISRDRILSNCWIALSKQIDQWVGLTAVKAFSQCDMKKVWK